MKEEKGISISYYIVFLISIFSLSKVFATDELFLAGNDVEAIFSLVFYTFVFLISMFYLAFKVYSDEKKKDNLKIRFEPFEKIYSLLERREIK